MAEVKEVPSKLEAMLAVIDTARKGIEAILGSGADIDRSLVDSISKLASAHANLSREAMRWDQRQRKEADAASLEDRKRGVVAFIAKLPLGERQAVYEALVAWESTATPGLPLKLS